MLNEVERAVVEEVASAARTRIARHYVPGFGICPSGDKRENFYGALWTRDCAHATATYLAVAEPHSAIDSLTTILKHQRSDGAVPYCIEREYSALRVLLPFPGSWRFSRPLFNLVERRILGREEKPYYEGQFNGAEDTVPLVVIAAAALTMSPEGLEFVRAHFNELERAVRFFNQKVDPTDGLAVVTRSNPDWTESIERKGKLALINVLWARSLALMARVAERVEAINAHSRYRKEAERIAATVLQKFYVREGAYFRAQTGDDRLDTGASVFGALFLLPAEEAAHVEESLKRRVSRFSGLVNFDPPYPRSQIHLALRWFGNTGYHNAYVWPWLTCENIRVKVKIAREHPEQAVRDVYRREAAKDLAKMAAAYKHTGGAYEILKPGCPEPARSLLYSPPRNFLASLAAYLGAHRLLEESGWL